MVNKSPVAGSSGRLAAEEEEEEDIFKNTLIKQSRN